MTSSKWIFFLLILHFTVGALVASAEEGVLAVKVLDTKGQPLKNVTLGPSGPGNSGTTDPYGQTRIRLPTETRPTNIVELEILSPEHKFVFISPWDQRVVVPAFENQPENFVKVVLGTPGDRDLLSNDAAVRAMACKIMKLLSSNSDHETTPELRAAALRQVAVIFGMSASDVDQSIRSWETRIQEPYDKGIAAFYDGRYSEAQQQLQIASDNRGADLQESIKKYADAKFFLGQCLYLQGKYRSAADAFRETQKWRPDDPLVLNNLALNLAQLGSLPEAEALYEHSVELQQQSATNEDFLLSQSIGSLGGVLLRQNKLDKAEGLLRQALAIRSQILPSDDPRIATSMNNLAVLLQAQGKLDEAETLLLRALEIQKHAANGQPVCLSQPKKQVDPTACTQLISDAQRGLTNSRIAIGNPGALATLDLSEKGIIGLSGLAQKRPGISTTMCNLALLYVAKHGDLVHAESLIKQAIEAEKRTLPIDHPDLATSLEALGDVLTQEGKVEDAKSTFRQALEIRLLNFGPEHIYVAELYDALSRVELQGNPTAAKEDLNRALRIETKWWGDTDPRTQATKNRIATISAN